MRPHREENAMLYALVNAENDTEFARMMTSIQNLYWPTEAFSFHHFDDVLNPFRTSTSDEEVLAKSKRAIYQYAEHVGLGQIYELPNGKRMAFPFLDRFYTYFLQRQWDAPYWKPGEMANEYIHLTRPEKGQGNYSLHGGDYNHFVNVVAATARIIAYFNDIEHVQKVCTHANITEKVFEDFASVVTYAELPDTRTFRVMLAAFMHDIGKTVVYERHGMEGECIIEDHSDLACGQISAILKKHTANARFGSDDMQLLATFVYYHEQFGTLWTGEEDYLRLVELCDRIKRYCLCHPSIKQDWKNWCKRHLFDVWVINVADIMVSRRDKWGPQRDLWVKADADARIEEFLFGPGREGTVQLRHGLPAGANLPINAKGLLHDLHTAVKLMNRHCHDEHGDNLGPLEHQAYAMSHRHTVERLMRLVTCTLITDLRTTFEQIKREAPEVDTPAVAQFIETLWSVNSGFIADTIVTAIRDTSDFNDYCSRFTWISKMDYSKSFFDAISRRALELVLPELVQLTSGNADQLRTRWISAIRLHECNDDEEYYFTVQAEQFLRNYVAVMIQIMFSLLYREKVIDSRRCIEFRIAYKRLTKEKIDKIISMSGPFLANKSIQLTLQSIYLYK
jgi:hypothetical protein